ncbi:LysR substrate-binding domain-containing protein [Streptomyces sp. NPDC059785]|uniref:LysR substrate-binding domain-containing protein n=1 Tax=Streptomyces sp. NPDC059785 TaxID=3346945 RepID=UPI00366A1D26
MLTSPAAAGPSGSGSGESRILAGRTAPAYSEVAEHPLVGLDADSSLRRWIEKHLEPHAPVVRYRTTVADLGVLITLAAAGAGLAVVPRHAVPPHQPLDVCELQDTWARRHHLLAWGVKDRAAPAAAALAERLRRAAQFEPSGETAVRLGSGHVTGARRS